MNNQNKSKPLSQIPAWIRWLFAGLAILTGASCHQADPGTIPVNLSCEYGTDPVGIDTEVPRLSWNISTPERNWMQFAYQVLVSSDSSGLSVNKGHIWNSGKVQSGDCLYVRYRGLPLKSQQKYWWKVRVWDRNGAASAWSRPAYWTMGMVDSAGWKGRWIASDLELSPLQKELKALPDFGMEPESEMWALNERIRRRTDSITLAPAVYFRKEFRLDRLPVRAQASICGLGLYELYINGNRVSDELLNPAISDYQKRILYRSYEVTQYLSTRDNTLGVILGNGWFNLVIPHALRMYAADYIATPRLLFQLDLFYADGSHQSVVSDESWKFTTDGPIRFNCLISGETCDARMELPGWNANGYDDRSWKAAQPADPPPGRLQAQMLYPVRVVDTVRAISLTPTKTGYSLELEKEITGWCRIRVHGEKGQKIIVRYPGAGSHTLGRYQTYEYILKGEPSETFDARFSYNGIRSVEIDGLGYRPEKIDITGLSVQTDLPQTGWFSCSDSIYNELYSILLHTMRNYVVHIPNDPVREKMGWTQDVETAFDVYAYALDSRSMYIKWQHDFLDIIHDNGYVPPVVPGRFDGPTINGPWWGGMIVYLPWRIYQYFGDQGILEESYPAMKKYTGYLQSIDSSRIINWGLGDWLEPGSDRPVMTPVSFTSTVAYYNTALITSRTAELLGHKEESRQYAKLAGEIRDAFNHHFYRPETGEYAKYSQTSQLLPLCFGLVPEENRGIVLDRLISRIKASGNHPGTGFVGTPYLLSGLSELGHGELAHTLASQRTYPGWYDMVFNHGTRIFKEDWGGGRVQMPPLGGGLGWWFFHSLAGIRPDPEAPGFKNVRIQPDFIGDLTFANGEYRSGYGSVKTGWRREDGRIILSVSIPANTTATIILPSADPSGITESGKSLAGRTEFHSVKTGNGQTTILAGSGDYQFEFKQSSN